MVASPPTHMWTLKMAVGNYHSNLSWFQLVFSFQQKATRLDVNQSGGKLDFVGLNSKVWGQTRYKVGANLIGGERGAIPSLTTTFLLWGGIFSNIVICSSNTLTSLKTGCTYINTTENTQVSYFLATYGWQFHKCNRPSARGDVFWYF